MLALLILFSVPAILLGLHFRQRWPPAARVAFLVFLVALTGFFVYQMADEVRDNVEDAREWDFLGFWLHAHTATRGGNFYDPAEAETSVTGVEVSDSFHREIIETGFWYPPPSMFLFLPLGWLDLATARTVWFAFNLLVLALDVFLLWRIFFPRGDATELLASALLIFSIHGTLSTLYFAQTNFIALAALLLFWRRPGTAWGGVWAAAGTLVKPFLGVLVLSTAAGARWRAVVGFAGAMAVLTVASAVAFGPQTLLDYLGSEAKPKPTAVYSQRTNQSMLGLFLRITDADCKRAACILNKFYLGAAAAVVGITLALGSRLARTHERWTAALCVLMALLVYPVSQLFYSVLLPPIVLLAWELRERIRGGAWTVAILGGLVYALAAARDGRMSVFAFGVLWLAMAVVGFGLIGSWSWPFRRPS